MINIETSTDGDYITISIDETPVVKIERSEQCECFTLALLKLNLEYLGLAHTQFEIVQALVETEEDFSIGFWI